MSILTPKIPDESHLHVHNQSMIDKYLINYSNKNKKTNKKIENKLKKQTNFKILKYDEHKLLREYNYTVDQLKIIINHYDLKLKGKKKELCDGLYYFLKYSKFAIKIQRLCKCYFMRRINNLIGLAPYKRHLCVNDTDFLSMDNLCDLEYFNFFSVNQNNTYFGFELKSFHNLINNMKYNVINPYNRVKFMEDDINRFKDLLRLLKIAKIKINLQIDSPIKSMKEQLQLRLTSLFIDMDLLGNYTDIKWFMNLKRNDIIKLLKELKDIWSYRVDLTIETKRNICPPSGQPFYHNRTSELYSYTDLQLKTYAVSVMENMVIRGTSFDYKYMGSSFLLSALTLVSLDAAESMPWLYQSVAYSDSDE